MAVEEMRYARLLLRSRTGGEDAQVAIDLHGIGIDDRAAERLRQRQGQRRLAARGRPCDQDGVACVRAAHRNLCRRIEAQPTRSRTNISPRNRRCPLAFTPLQGQIRELVKDDSWLVSHGWSADSWHGRHDPDRLSTRTWDSRITRIEPAFATD